MMHKNIINNYCDFRVIMITTLRTLTLDTVYIRSDDICDTTRHHYYA